MTRFHKRSWQQYAAASSGHVDRFAHADASALEHVPWIAQRMPDLVDLQRLGASTMRAHRTNIDAPNEAP